MTAYENDIISIGARVIASQRVTRAVPQVTKVVEKRPNGSALIDYDFTETKDEQPERLRLYKPGDLDVPSPPLKPLIRGVAATGTFGPFGGKQKTLKSICADALGLAVATGRPAFGFDRWSVPERGVVLIFAGEGGIELTKRRLKRIAHDVYGIESLATLPLYVVDGVAGMDTKEFADKLREAVQEIRQEQGDDPALFILDALYNYHPAEVEVSNLYERGQMLSDFQRLVHGITGEDCVIWIVDHFRKAAAGTGLDEYQQSGMGAWADSWWNAEHRKDPDLDNNVFCLNVEIGSRQGYAGLYEIDIDLGPFNEDTMEWEGTMKVRVERVGAHKRERKGGDAIGSDEIERQICALAEERKFTRNDIKTRVGAGQNRVDRALVSLVDSRIVVWKDGLHEEGGRTVKRPLLHPVGKIELSPRTEPVDDASA